MVGFCKKKFKKIGISPHFFNRGIPIRIIRVIRRQKHLYAVKPGAPELGFNGLNGCPQKEKRKQFSCLRFPIFVFTP